MSQAGTWLKAIIPLPLRRRLRRMRYTATVLRRMGGFVPRECPCCGYRGKFAASGYPPRYDAECLNCGSMERHRLLQLAFDRWSLLSPGMSVIHFAPEPMVSKRIPAWVDYRTADIRPGLADLVLNLEALDIPDGSVSAVIANHVLEHVDDRKALSELHRILEPGGRLIATIPIVEGWERSYENPAIQDEAGRTLHFGQFDHVRMYGRDFRERVRAAGLSLREFVADGEECVRYSLTPGERVFVAEKAS